MAYVVTGYWVAGYVTSDSEAALSSAIQSVAPGAIIELFELELNVAQHGVATTYRFHAGVNQLTTDLTWNGEIYQALPITAEGFELTGKGTLPRPKLAVSNIAGTISTLLTTLPEGLQGAKVTRIRTLGRYLDAVNFPGSVNPTADPYAEFPRQVYFIDRLALENRDLIEFELASVFDLAGVRADFLDHAEIQVHAQLDRDRALFDALVDRLRDVIMPPPCAVAFVLPGHRPVEAPWYRSIPRMRSSSASA